MNLGSLALSVPASLDATYRYVHPAGSDGSDGRSVTSPKVSLQAAVNDILASSYPAGIIYASAGSWDAGVVDLSALKTLNKSLSIVGSGSGAGQTAFNGTTVFLNSSGSTWLAANGALTGNHPIIGVRFSGFAVKNTATMGASTFTVSLDYCTEQVDVSDVYVYANGKGGNGIAYMNFALGQSRWSSVVTQGFTTGTGFKAGCEVTSNVGTAPNSGNSVFVACASRDALTGFDVNGSGNLLNGCSFVSCKSVNASDLAGSIGFRVRGSAHQNAFVACHAERFSTGYSIESAKMNTLVAPLASYPAGTPDAASAGIRMSGSATGNWVTSGRLTNTHYGVSFEDTAQSNFASGDDAASNRVLTAFYNDASATKNNVTWKIEDGVTVPVWSFANNDVRVNKLGVNNSAAATVLGSVVKKMQVFDASGVSLGYLPIYDAIT